MINAVALVLAGGRIGQYGVLTQNRAKGALTFAGHFRIIDFALSCLRRAHIEQIGIIIQYLPSSLIEHVGVGIPWDLNGYGRSLKIMPPFVGVEKTEWYKGTADALYQNLNFLDDANSEDVIVMSGEHVVDVDFQDAIHAHHDQKADITFIVKEMPADICSTRFGYVTTDDADRIDRFVEKPTTIPSGLVSTGIYIFKTGVLRKLLQQQAGGPNQNLAKDILEKFAPSLRCYAYRMPGEWGYMETIADFFNTQMYCLTNEGFERLQRWEVLTNLDFRGVGFAAASKICDGAKVTSSLISPNCHIEGTVERCILSPGVVVKKNAVVRDSIIMHDCVVENGAEISHVVSDRDVHFGMNSHVGQDREGKPQPDDLVLVGKGARIGDKATVSAGTQIPARSVVK